MGLAKIGNFLNELSGLTRSNDSQSPLPTTPAFVEDANTFGAEARRHDLNFQGAMLQHRLRAQLAARDASAASSVQDGATPKGRVEFKVLMPKSYDPRALRDALLKSKDFNYTTEDIAELDRRYGEKGFYLYDNQAPERWATSDEVKTWAVRDGFVTIPVDAEKVRHLQNFRIERRINAATAGISDAGLRQQVVNHLFITATAQGGARVQAAIDLSVLAQKNPAAANSIAATLREVANQPEGHTNAALRLAQARVSLVQAQQRYGPYDAEENYRATKNLTWDAVKLAAGRDPATNEGRAGTVVNREEAALINKYAGIIFKETGDTYQAGRHEKLGRFYEMTDEQRQGLDGFGGERISRWYNRETTRRIETRREVLVDGEMRKVVEVETRPPVKEGHSMRSVSDREWQLEREARGVQQQIDHVMKVTDERKGVDDNALDTRFAGPQEPLTMVKPDSKTVFVPNKEGYQQKDQVDYRPIKPNAGGAARGAGIVKGVDAINEFNKWMTIIHRTHVLPPLYAERDRVQAALRDEDTYRVPPRPERLAWERAEIEQALDPSRRRDPQVQAWLDQYMQVMKEESHAFWGK